MLLCTAPLVQSLACRALGLLPKTEKWQARRESWQTQLDTLSEESRHLLTEKNRCLKIFAVHLCKLFLMYTIPYFCLRFMGLSSALSFGQVQLLTALMLFLSNALPNVAGMGSIETAFLLVFGAFLPRGETMSVLMLFRIASYYVVVAVSAVGFFFAQKECQKIGIRRTKSQPPAGTFRSEAGFGFGGRKDKRKASRIIPRRLVVAGAGFEPTTFGL